MLIRLELDPSTFRNESSESRYRNSDARPLADYELRKKTPSPIRRIENNNVMFFGGHH